jgi:hypothetical protein
LQAANLSDTEERSEVYEQLAECEIALRKGPGGDLRKFQKKQRKPLLLRLLLGSHCPVQASIHHALSLFVRPILG